MHSYKSHSFSLSVKLNQDKRFPVPHFLWSLAKPCSPFPNLHLPQPGTTPSLCLGRHLQPELPIPLACRPAPLPAPLSSKKVTEDFWKRSFTVKLFQSPALKALYQKKSGKTRVHLGIQLTLHQASIPHATACLCWDRR